MAKKFNFRLQSVLNLKDFRQKLLSQDLSKLLNQLSLANQRMGFLELSLHKGKKDLDMELSNNIDTLKVRLFNQYIDYIYEGMEEQEKVIESIEEAIIEKRSQIKKAETEKKVIGKLKEREFQDYRKKRNMQLQKENDEFYSKQPAYVKKVFK